MLSEKFVLGLAMVAGAAAVMCIQAAKEKFDKQTELKEKSKKVLDDSLELGKAVGSVAKNVAKDAISEVKFATDVIFDDIKSTFDDSEGADIESEDIEIEAPEEDAISDEDIITDEEVAVDDIDIEAPVENDVPISTDDDVAVDFGDSESDETGIDDTDISE